MFGIRYQWKSPKEKKDPHRVPKKIVKNTGGMKVGLTKFPHEKSSRSRFRTFFDRLVRRPSSLLTTPVDGTAAVAHVDESCLDSLVSRLLAIVWSASAGCSSSDEARSINSMFEFESPFEISLFFRIFCDVSTFDGIEDETSSSSRLLGTYKHTAGSE